MGGYIFDYGGVPLAQATLQLLDRQEVFGAKGSETVSDETGWFRFDGVAPGPWELFAAVEPPHVSRWCMQYAGSVAVPTGEFVRMDVRLPGTAELSGQYTILRSSVAVSNRNRTFTPRDTASARAEAMPASE